jgi:hypothetical protein
MGLSAFDADAHSVMAEMSKLATTCRNSERIVLMQIRGSGGFAGYPINAVAWRSNFRREIGDLSPMPHVCGSHQESSSLANGDPIR